MDWIHHYQLFLFDFDGLLVNTEEIHFAAYQRMLKRRGYNLPWDFPRYCKAAHYDSEALSVQIYEEFPALLKEEPRWAKALYLEKKQAYMELLQEGAVKLMPGACELLLALKEANIKRSVVTHSPSEQIDSIRQQLPVLNTISEWFTREHYTRPKPDPECYIKAIQKMALENEKVIGFEDTPRGIKALQGSRAQVVMICSSDYPGLKDVSKEGGLVHFPTLAAVKM